MKKDWNSTSKEDFIKELEVYQKTGGDLLSMSDQIGDDDLIDEFHNWYQLVSMRLSDVLPSTPYGTKFLSKISQKQPNDTNTEFKRIIKKDLVTLLNYIEIVKRQIEKIPDSAFVEMNNNILETQAPSHKFEEMSFAELWRSASWGQIVAVLGVLMSLSTAGYYIGTVKVDWDSYGVKQENEKLKSENNILIQQNKNLNGIIDSLYRMAHPDTSIIKNSK